MASRGSSSWTTCKSGVTTPDWYEPTVNRGYQDLLGHLGAVAIPGRVGKSRDKAKVENGVLQVERWVLAPLRDRTLIGLGEARGAVLELVDRLNERPFQKMAGSRSSVFTELDRPALQPLPKTGWVPTEWKRLKVHIDYHVEVGHHYFSVPYQLIGETLDVKVTPTLVEIFRKGRPVAAHRRSEARYTTTRSTCRARTGSIAGGARHASSPGPRRSAPTSASWSTSCCRRGSTPSRGIGRAWASCGWPTATARSAWMPRAVGRWPSPR